MGHSWGGFSTLNIPALHPEISHTVVMCGFVSVEEIVKSFFSGLLKGYRRAVSELEKGSNPRFYGYNGIESLKNTKTRALLIYSDNDMLCRIGHYEILKRELDGLDNVKLLLTSNKGHNPNYTEDAVKYIGEFGKARAKLLRNKKATKEDKARFVESFDWHRMTEQDNEVWEKILAHLES
jgi:pimeloyl-ACP methyl ester carboxylesterase